MARIDNLSYSNYQTQGGKRRAWLQQHSPQHLQQSAALISLALHQRQRGTSQSTLVLGAGACTEVPLAELCRISDDVVLVDLDLAAIQAGRDELASPTLRKRVHLLKTDISAGVSNNLARLIARQNWQNVVPEGARAVFDAASLCLEQCPVPDPPYIQGLPTGEFGLVISSLVLTQLFSYPILDLLDHVQRIAPTFLNEQERHHRYQEAAQNFRIRIINAHLHLLRDLLDTGGIAVLLSDLRGFVFNIHGTDHDATHRRTMPLVPRTFPNLVRDTFTTLEESQWEWLTDLPEKDRPGRGYEVAGYVLRPASL